MANYKNIVDVESVAEATESMNVLVEDAGSLKKVPAGGMLGGNENFCFIDGEIIIAPTAASAALPNADFTASMSYSELKALFQNKELAGVIVRYHDGNNFSTYIMADTIELNAVNEIIMHGYLASQEVEGYIFYHSDGRINYETDVPSDE